MARTAGNPNWGKEQSTVPVVTDFDLKVTQLHLAPDQYVGSAELRIWAAVHRHTRYVPESLLKAWGMFVE